MEVVKQKNKVLKNAMKSASTKIFQYSTEQGPNFEGSPAQSKELNQLTSRSPT